MQKLAAEFLVGGVLVTLSGCGNSPTSAPGTTPAGPTTTMVTTTATTTLPTDGSAPWECTAAAQTLNNKFHGYQPHNPHSPNGIAVSMFNPVAGVDKLTSFDDQIFCSAAPGHEQDSCYKGQAECRMSSAIMNHHIYVNLSSNAPISYYQSVGIILNQDKVETEIGKCAYSWDGAANVRKNRGCGDGGTANCGDPSSAFADQCGIPPGQHDGGHICGRDDPEVAGQRCSCTEDWCSESKDKYGEKTPAASRADDQCFYEMPGLIASENPTKTNHLKDMLRNRYETQTNTGCPGIRTSTSLTDVCQDTEVIIDTELLIRALQKDGFSAIDAFVYTKGNKDQAVIMRDNFHQKFNLPEDKPKIPVLLMDQEDDFHVKGPLICEDEMFI